MKAPVLLVFCITVAGCTSAPVAKQGVSEPTFHQGEAKPTVPEIDIGKVELTVISPEAVDEALGRAEKPICSYPQASKEHWWQFWKRSPNKRPDGTSAETPPSNPSQGAAVPHP